MDLPEVNVISTASSVEETSKLLTLTMLRIFCVFASFTSPSTPGRSYSNLLPRVGLTPTFYPQQVLLQPSTSGRSYSNLLLREGLTPIFYSGKVLHSTFYPGKFLLHLLLRRECYSQHMENSPSLKNNMYIYTHLWFNLNNCILIDLFGNK